MEDYERKIGESVAGIDLSIVINNAGYMMPGEFEKVDIDEHRKMIDVGIMPATLITKVLTAKLLKRVKRTAVIFVSSVQAQAPLAGTGTYGASKVYLDYLSKALAHENRQNMDVLSYQCGLVATKFIGYDPSQKKKPSTFYQKLFCITPEQAAERSLADLGYEFITHGHIRHDIYAMFIRLMSTNWLLAPIFNRSAKAKANNALKKL